MHRIFLGLILAFFSTVLNAGQDYWISTFFGNHGFASPIDGCMEYESIYSTTYVNYGGYYNTEGTQYRCQFKYVSDTSDIERAYLTMNKLYCEPGEEFNVETQLCEVPNDCPSNQVKDPETGQCTCPSGSYQEITGLCEPCSREGPPISRNVAPDDISVQNICVGSCQYHYVTAEPNVNGGFLVSYGMTGFACVTGMPGPPDDNPGPYPDVYDTPQDGGGVDGEPVTATELPTITVDTEITQTSTGTDDNGNPTETTITTHTNSDGTTTTETTTVTTNPDGSTTTTTTTTGGGAGGSGSGPVDPLALPDLEDQPSAAEATTSAFDRIQNSPIVVAVSNITTSFPSGGSCPSLSIDTPWGSVSTNIVCELWSVVSSVFGSVMMAAWLILGAKIVMSA